jgi:hypothetical protein
MMAATIFMMHSIQNKGSGTTSRTGRRCPEMVADYFEANQASCMPGDASACFSSDLYFPGSFSGRGLRRARAQKKGRCTKAVPPPDDRNMPRLSFAKNPVAWTSEAQSRGSTFPALRAAKFTTVGLRCAGPSYEKPCRPAVIANRAL